MHVTPRLGRFWREKNLIPARFTGWETRSERGGRGGLVVGIFKSKKKDHSHPTDNALVKGKFVKLEKKTHEGTLREPKRIVDRKAGLWYMRIQCEAERRNNRNLKIRGRRGQLKSLPWMLIPKRGEWDGKNTKIRKQIRNSWGINEGGIKGASLMIIVNANRCQEGGTLGGLTNNGRNTGERRKIYINKKTLRNL